MFFTKERKNFLRKYGYVVIPSVVNTNECKKMEEDLFSFLKLYDEKLDRNNIKNWNSKTIPVGTIHGINRLASNLQVQWDARQHPNVVKCFSEYWKTDDLVCSFDGFGLYLASSIKRKSGSWPHTDQGNRKSDKKEPLKGKCIQGFLNLIDSTDDEDGGLIVWKKSHKAWRKYYEINNIYTKDHWYKYPESYINEIEKDASKYTKFKKIKMSRIKIKAKAGDMVFWYSKTIHQNEAPFTKDKNKKLHDRAVIYISMCPKKYLTEKDIEKRKKCFFENRQSSHWPAGNSVKIFPKTFRYYTSDKNIIKYYEDKIKNIFNKMEKLVLSDIGKSLLGFEVN